METVCIGIIAMSFMMVVAASTSTSPAARAPSCALDQSMVAFFQNTIKKLNIILCKNRFLLSFYAFEMHCQR